MVSDKNIFSCFPYISICTTCDPGGGPIFGPRGIIRTNLVKVFWLMLHTNYQGSNSCGFRQEDFSCFPIHVSAYVKHVTWGGHFFWPQGQYMNIFGRVLLVVATYQI